MNKNYISIKSIIEDYTAKTGNNDIEPNQILRFANDALDRILPGEEFQHNIALLDVNDYKAQLPSNFKYVLQAAYSSYDDDPRHYHHHSSQEIVEYTKKIYGSNCELKLDVHCDRCGDYDNCSGEVIKMDVDHNFLLKNPSYLYKYSHHYYGGRTLDPHNPKDPYYDQRFHDHHLPHSHHHHTHHHIHNNCHGENCTGDSSSNNHCTLHPHFHLMRRTSNYYFNVPYHVNECININADSKVEYDIYLPNMLVNFKKGQVLLSYLGSNVDSEGYLMIPNVPLIFDAVILWIEERLAYIDYRKNKEVKERTFWQQSLQLRDKAVKQARSYLATPTPDEWEMFIRNHWIRKVPNYRWEAFHNKHVGDKKYSETTIIGKF